MSYNRKVNSCGILLTNSGFENFKQALCRDNMLSAFAPNLEVIVTCDVSDYGLVHAIHTQMKNSTESTAA